MWIDLQQGILQEFVEAARPIMTRYRARFEHWRAQRGREHRDYMREWVKSPAGRASLARPEAVAKKRAQWSSPRRRERRLERRREMTPEQLTIERAKAAARERARRQSPEVRALQAERERERYRARQRGEKS